MKIEWKDEKKEWILLFAKRYKCLPNYDVDEFCEEFVNKYIDKFKISNFGYYPYGAPEIPEIKKLLDTMKMDIQYGSILIFRL